MPFSPLKRRFSPAKLNTNLSGLEKKDIPLGSGPRQDLPEFPVSRHVVTTRQTRQNFTDVREVFFLTDASELRGRPPSFSCFFSFRLSAFRTQAITQSVDSTAYSEEISCVFPYRKAFSPRVRKVRTSVLF